MFSPCCLLRFAAIIADIAITLSSAIDAIDISRHYATLRWLSLRHSFRHCSDTDFAAISTLAIAITPRFRRRHYFAAAISPMISFRHYLYAITLSLSLIFATLLIDAADDYFARY
jgi:hypothetical protein